MTLVGSMEPRHFAWDSQTGPQELVLAWVPETSGTPYAFGHGACPCPETLPWSLLQSNDVSEGSYGQDASPARSRRTLGVFPRSDWLRFFAGRT